MNHRRWPFKYFPTREKILENPILKRLGPILHAHHLWHMSRRGIATGIAVGTFIGVLIPIAQIPIASGISIALRANLPATVAATFISNPLTTPALFYGAYHLGAWVTGEKKRPKVPATPPSENATFGHSIHNFGIQVMTMGRPVLVGLVIIAIFGSLISYYGVHWLWRWKIMAKRRRIRIRPG
jgi:uncharacterized protein